jgi:L-2-hydroxyglutarate oxidase LhgO
MLSTVAKIGRWIEISEMSMGRMRRARRGGARDRTGVYYASMEEVDVVVVGAGVIGLAIARAIAHSGREVWILEAAGTFGTQTSSRNSEVIHAGIYYPPGSLKARLCVAGRDQLYRYCEVHAIPHRRCGKLIVATSGSELAELDGIQATARASGVDLESLSARQVAAMEPALRCMGALHSPGTGIIDCHTYMLTLLGDAERHGATLVCNSPVAAGRLDAHGIVVSVAGSSTQIRARLLVNCAGLQAPQLARRIEGFPAGHVPRLCFAKGSYFTLAGRSPFSRLVYPVPERGGLGVHLTLDLAGRARFGPDVEWVESCDYAVDPARAGRFYEAVRRYWPGLAQGALLPGYAGVRPRLAAPGEPGADFRIDGPATHGVPSVINLFGIESPGLTASLALADMVAAMAAACFASRAVRW